MQNGEDGKGPAPQQQQQQGTVAPSQALKERASPSMVFQEGAHVAAVDHTKAKFGKVCLLRVLNLSRHHLRSRCVAGVHKGALLE